MMPRDDNALREENRLLRGLPAEETSRIEEILELAPIRSKEILTEPGGVITHVHFPQSGVISLVSVLGEGGGVEALTVGRDGMSGTAVLNGASTSFVRIVGQIPGEAKRAPVNVFLETLAGLPVLSRRVRLYSQYAMDAVSQSVACNRVHVTEERCARWLLMSHDRAGRDEFQLTQNFLSQMLGIRRPAVTVAVGLLERAGLIEHRRGHIRITDRTGLEAAACECYVYLKRRENDILS